jgi:vacuolar protein sorting-associated protein 33A
MWDESLTGPVSLIAKPTLLKDMSVVKMFPITPGDLPNVDVRNFIFITRPSLQTMNAIASNVHSDEKKNRMKEFLSLFSAIKITLM